MLSRLVERETALLGHRGGTASHRKLKAIVVDGSKNLKVEVADPAGLKARIQADTKLVQSKTKPLKEFGTSGGVPTARRADDACSF